MISTWEKHGKDSHPKLQQLQHWQHHYMAKHKQASFGNWHF